MRISRLVMLTITLAITFALAPPAVAGPGEDKGQSKKVEKAAEQSRDEMRERHEDTIEEGQKSRGDEMQTRRDERKAIMDDAKTTSEPGTPRKGKKAWWKFWGSDEEE